MIEHIVEEGRRPLGAAGKIKVFQSFYALIISEVRAYQPQSYVRSSREQFTTDSDQRHSSI